MVQKNNVRKGAAMAELMVVLAVVTLVSTVVVSFAVMVSQRTTISAAQLHTMGDSSTIESITEGWILRMDQLGAKISPDGGSLTATVTVTADGVTDTEEYHLTFTAPEDGDEGKLQGTLPDGETLLCYTKQVLAVSFAAMQREDGSDALYFCTVTAQIPAMGNAAPQEQKQTFCVNPHVGDTVGMTAGGGAQ